MLQNLCTGLVQRLDVNTEDVNVYVNVYLDAQNVLEICQEDTVKASASCMEIFSNFVDELQCAKCYQDAQHASQRERQKQDMFKQINGLDEQGCERLQRLVDLTESRGHQQMLGFMDMVSHIIQSLNEHAAAWRIMHLPRSKRARVDVGTFDEPVRRRIAA